MILKYITVISDNLNIKPVYTVETENCYKDMDINDIIKYKECIDNIDIVDGKLVYKGIKAEVISITEAQLRYAGRCIKGFNDLYTYAKKNNRLYLIEEFNDNTCSINSIAYSSNKKVLWKCNTCNYEWEATVSSRTHSNTMCPNCNRGKATSVNEQLIYLALKKKHSDTLNRYKVNIENKEFEIDIFNSRLGILIDYRGAYSHKLDRVLSKDSELDSICKSKGIRLIVIHEVESGESGIIGSSIIYNYKTDKDRKILIKLLNILLKQYNVELSIDNNILHEAYMNSLKGNKYNNAKNEDWTSDVSGNVNLANVPRRSHTKLEFTCSLGHVYETTPDKKSRGDGCPYCSGHRILKGFNDMLTTHPIMSRDLDVEKSGFRADEVMATSHKKVYWKCQFCGHEWSHSLIKSRVARGRVSKCPNCKTIINE